MRRTRGVESPYLNLGRSTLSDQAAENRGWSERRRERKRLKRERKGDSTEKRAERHTPAESVTDRMLRLGGVQRQSRFKGK
jgi:hypothetical protein